MRIIVGEYGGFIVEFIAGTATLISVGVVWHMIQQYMDKIVFLLV